MSEELARARQSYARRGWAEARRAFLRADTDDPLGIDDLERLAVACYLVDRGEEYLRTLERVHHDCLEVGDPARAARYGFWIGLALLFRGEIGPATGWLGRARRLLEELGGETVEAGYLLLPEAEMLLRSGDLEAASSRASRAVAIGERFDDIDLVACGRHLYGRALVLLGRVDSGLAALDETMVSVTAGELSPIVTGLIYCSVIDACREVFAHSRAREWTEALSRWCEEQSQLAAFGGTCLVRHAEILRFHGEWDEAMAAAGGAIERSERGLEPHRPGAAFYERGETLRLRGDLAGAEEAYRRASEDGREPQPGLALLRLAQGRAEQASAAIRRVLAEDPGPLKRALLLPALVEVELASRRIDEAREAAEELESIARRFQTPVLAARAAQCRGAVELAEGDPRAALSSLRRAVDGWRAADAPYDRARAQILLAQACRELGDADAFALEVEAARVVFEELGATPDLERIEAVRGAAGPRRSHGLSPRELEVLRLVATGATNRAVADRLSISERTVARHVSNIFDKLDVSSRAAATAYAFRHGLIQD